MHRRSRLPTLLLALPLILAGTAAIPAFAQTAPAPATEPPPFAPAAPPPSPADDGLFPAPNTARPAPPLAAPGELRSAGTAAQRGRRNNNQGGRFSGERQRQIINPSLDAASTDPVEIRIAYRRAETEAKRDPIFVDLLRRADLAHDDEERRALLRRYYTELFVRVRQINRSPALAVHVATLSRAAELRYAPKRRAGGVDERELGRGGGRGNGQR